MDLSKSIREDVEDYHKNHVFYKVIKANDGSKLALSRNGGHLLIYQELTFIQRLVCSLCPKGNLGRDILDNNRCIEKHCKRYMFPLKRFK